MQFVLIFLWYPMFLSVDSVFFSYFFLFSFFLAYLYLHSFWCCSDGKLFLPIIFLCLSGQKSLVMLVTLIWRYLRWIHTQDWLILKTDARCFGSNTGYANSYFKLLLCREMQLLLILPQTLPKRGCLSLKASSLNIFHNWRTYIQSYCPGQTEGPWAWGESNSGEDKSFLSSGMMNCCKCTILFPLITFLIFF